MGGRGSWSASRKRKYSNTGGNKGQRIPKPMDVDQFQGMTLQEIENMIRGLDHEELLAIDANGAILEAYKGISDSVAFYASLLSVPGITVTHNHPVGAEGYGGTLSIKDALNMASSDWAEHRAVASGSGELNYIIRRTSKTTAKNSRDLYARITADAPSLKAEYVKIANQVSGDLPGSKRRQIYTGVLDRYWSETLPRYNFEYVTRNKPYKYNR